MTCYDIIIAGSGMGGLACGAILSMEGYKVCIIEKNRQIGGSLQTFVRNRIIFDSGVHYIGGLEKGQNLYQIFNYLGIMDKLKLERMDMNAFDNILVEGDDNVYPLAQGYDNFVKHLSVFFPGEKEAIENYIHTIKDVCSKFPLYNLQSGRNFWEKANIMQLGLEQVVESITSNKKLQQVLTGNTMLYAGEPDKTPFYVHALILNSYMESAWRCVDGGSQIGKLLLQKIRAHGGEVIRNCEVTEFVERDEQIDCVKLSDGRYLHAKHFISNIHPHRTLELIKGETIRPAYRKRIKSLENTIASFTLSIALKKNSFKYQKSNYYFNKTDSVEGNFHYNENNWPAHWSFFMSASSQNTEYAESVTILAYMRYEDVKKWESSFNTVSFNKSRGHDYEEFKKQKAEQLIAEAGKKFPGLNDCIENYYTATPLTYRDYIGSRDGSMYGLSKDYRDFMKTFILPKTKLTNLYLTGQNISMHGILGATMGALYTCSFLTDIDKLLEKIRNA